MNICIVGSGYVGLVAGTCLADFGMNVTCVDNDKNKIEALNKGEVPIYELGLSDMIQRNLKLERLHFTTDLQDAVKRSLVIFLAVGTPQDKSGKADLSQIFDVCEKIAENITEYKVLICKSTVPVGTSAAIEKLIKKKQKNNIEFDVISNPEFLREGSAVNDFLQPDRVVVGCKSERARAIIHDIYRSLYITDTPFIDCSNETAELIKYAANTMLALKISYINEIANLCELIGADITQVGAAVGLDSRIGPHFLHPGPGFGGSCLPKDVSAINEVAHKNNFEFKLAQAIMEINKRQQDIIVEKSKTILGNLKDKKICLLGLAFKPNTDDVRDAPAIYIAQKL
ncbi:MAG: UDP-glucose/GDP-mannose dehydrogenase family protein, partial [candidate division Zixibacteria bacterium]|nr:UDP-glucose/GDP-mannose dehydrogenase family protein [candidate division Zixibacteria bacterium]